MNSVILDTGPCLNFLSVGQGNLMHETLKIKYGQLYVPREVATEIADKSADSQKFAKASKIFGAFVRDSMIDVLESDAENDFELVQAIREVSPLPPAELLIRRRKDLGEIMVVAHAIKLRDHGYNVRLVIDDRGGQALAERHGFEVVSTVRILATAASLGLVDYSDMKMIYERLRPSDGSEPMDDGLPHWDSTDLSNKRLYK